MYHWEFIFREHVFGNMCFENTIFKKMKGYIAVLRMRLDYNLFELHFHLYLSKSSVVSDFLAVTVKVESV